MKPLVTPHLLSHGTVECQDMAKTRRFYERYPDDRTRIGRVADLRQDRPLCCLATRGAWCYKHMQLSRVFEGSGNADLRVLSGERFCE